MLLNHTNRPSINWPPNQMQAATESYQKVQDLPFPAIDPQWTTDEVLQEVERQEIIIRQLKPMAVHIMGELVYTHLLVSRLKAIGIPCIASTTERVVDEGKDGSKTSRFQFVQFRQY